MNAPARSESSRLPIEDPELDGLVARFGHRVHFFSHRVERRFGLGLQWRDDLVSAGYWGLLKALRNRRLDAHEHELSAYVSQRIEGAVLDEARQLLTRLSNHADCQVDDLESGLAHESSNNEWEFDRACPDPEELADQKGRWRTIERSIDHLAQDHRDLLLAYAAGRSLAEIARSDGSNPARLQNQMTRIGRSVRARTPELRRILRHED
jgi:RNA polymerase sigma factor (sigma-70 family)